MDDREAIDQYNRVADAQPPLARAHWPDIALDAANLARLTEGVLDTHCDFARLAFGDEFDPAAVAGEIVEEWRTDAVHARYAPEGVFVRARFEIRVVIRRAAEVAGELDIQDVDTAVETLQIEAQLCLSFTPLRHTRPFIDFMQGEVRRASDGGVRRLDPFAREISPPEAVEWGLNGA